MIKNLTERRENMRYTISTLLLILLMLSSAPAYCHLGCNVNIEIVSDNGKEFLTIPFKDIKTGSIHIIKKYLEAKRVENYSIGIRNNTPERIGVVIAVDGRNIITGKKSFLKNNETMYIVDAYGYTKLDGWRTDHDTVHRFYFTDIGDSYSVRTFGDSSAMGVIAVAAFRDKERPIIYERQMQKEKAPGAASKPFARSESKEFKGDAAGTGFGDEKYSPVVKVHFEPESIPFEKILVKYEWRDTLCRKGLLKCLPEEGNRLWDEDEYAPYPPEAKRRGERTKSAAGLFPVRWI